MLKHLEVKNFRSCYDTKVDFDQSLCAISGRNGVGKSNVLKSIEWLASSVITTDGVRVGTVGNTVSPFDEVSIQATMVIDKCFYTYDLKVPASGRKLPGTSLNAMGVSERLLLQSGDPDETIVYNRRGELIQFGNRKDEIRIPRSTPALAALFSLLPADDFARLHIERITSFFGGVRYYSLDDRPDARDYVTEQIYNDWKYRYENEGFLTNSVALRLIYMWYEKKDSFEELVTILGPDGLDLVARIDVMPLERSLNPPGSKEGMASSTKIYMPLFMPTSHMGGSGGLFPFSDLSVGTRRVARIITSLLFDRRSLMLMEQPEDSVHPGLLRKLIDQLRTYSHISQILFTTHSLEVMDILQPEEILLASAPDGSTKIRSLNPHEIERAKLFLKNVGALSDFLEPLDDVQ